MSDRIFGLFGLALTAFYLWATYIIPDSFMIDVIGPRAFPYIVGTVLGICSLYFLLRPDEEPDWPILINLIEITWNTLIVLTIPGCLDGVLTTLAKGCNIST